MGWTRSHVAVEGAMTPTDWVDRDSAFRRFPLAVRRFAQYTCIRRLRARLAVAVIRRGRRVGLNG
jgi:hypothetical protein